MRSGIPTAARPPRRAPRARHRCAAPVAREAAAKASKTKTGAAKKVAEIPEFIAPQLCTSVEKPPNSDGWCHEIKFDGYRVQLRVEDGEAVVKTRKGLDWSDKFGAIVREAGKLPDALIDGEIVALQNNGMPHFSTLQAALSDGKTDQLRSFTRSTSVCPAMGLRPLPLAPNARRCCRRLLDGAQEAEELIRYVEHFEERRRRRAGFRAQARAGRHRLQTARRRLSLRPLGRLRPKQRYRAGRRS